MINTNQNAEVYREMVTTGKSLMQLYLEARAENRKLREIVLEAVSAHSK
jgi:hypothetical protein